MRLYTPADADALAALLTGSSWPFHGRPGVDAEAARGMTGGFHGDGVRAFWIGGALGVIRLVDLGDPTAVVDLRIAAAHRGRGLGPAALRFATSYAFAGFPGLRRVEGVTRLDNTAMRAVFTRCGYVKEGHHRRAWPAAGTWHDAITYAVLREDWASGTTTPVDWAS
ncbi:hypothetical protein Afil01_56810 [Actinorhabdospora filicis]|uniref:N-acetyltransferase domain-containing protein n=1 Tax=Actinorhabdospora filicis TaxID=1785913 RepID=A0A9W6SRY3_9ACTN|nr:GNAT family protein [Actinorhabdospora filicis]GLZ80874.1 hypothetical protein Afil01_56810 [Actinorhabdospora filicis]